jgi:hypothetical protein
VENSFSFVDKGGIPSINSCDQAFHDGKSPQEGSNKKGLQKKPTFEVKDRQQA